VPLEAGLGLYSFVHGGEVKMEFTERDILLKQEEK
jgi:hypothetical protein